MCDWENRNTIFCQNNNLNYTFTISGFDTFEFKEIENLAFSWQIVLSVTWKPVRWDNLISVELYWVFALKYSGSVYVIWPSCHIFIKGSNCVRFYCRKLCLEPVNIVETFIAKALVNYSLSCVTLTSAFLSEKRTGSKCMTVVTILRKSFFCWR